MSFLWSPVGTPNTQQMGASSAKKPAKFLELAGFFLPTAPTGCYWKQEKEGVQLRATEFNHARGIPHHAYGCTNSQREATRQGLQAL